MEPWCCFSSSPRVNFISGVLISLASQEESGVIDQKEGPNAESTTKLLQFFLEFFFILQQPQHHHLESEEVRRR